MSPNFSIRQSVREHAGWFWGVIGGVATLLSLAVAILPNFRGILELGWLVGWTTALMLGIGWAATWRIQDKSRQHLETKVNGLENSLGQQRDHVTELEASRESHDKELESAREERNAFERDLESARIQLRSLQKPTVTDRDKQLFVRLGEEWPWTQGTLYWLEDSFNAKQWSSQVAEQVVSFADRERETRFDDRLVDACLVRFRDACREFSEWLTGNSFPSDANPRMQVVPVRGNSEAAYKSFETTREEGFRLAKEVVNSWRAIDRTSRVRGL